MQEVILHSVVHVPCRGVQTILRKRVCQPSDLIPGKRLSDNWNRLKTMCPIIRLSCPDSQHDFSKFGTAQEIWTHAFHAEDLN
jgi:hypothetical protein